MNDRIYDRIYMKKACELSEYSIRNNGGPFGAVIVNNKGEIIGQGHNRVTIDNDPTQHAEMVAIRDSCKNICDFRLTDCTLYTSCEPCPMCLSASYWAHISRIVYGNTREDAKNIGFDDDFIYEEIGKSYEERKIPIVRDGCEMSQKGFTLWSEKKDKVEY